MQFAEIVKEARLQAHLSQQRLAEQLVTARRPKGVWATYIGQIEKGEKVPSDEVCIKLAEVLELDTNTVLIAAYEAKASSEEGRALYGKMMRSLSDPVVNKLLSSKEPLDPALLGLLSNPEIVALLGDQSWLEAVATRGGTRCVGPARAGRGDGRQTVEYDNGHYRDLELRTA